MKNEIEQIIVNHIDSKISLGEATTQILRLFAVSGQSEQLLAFCDHLNTYTGMEEIRFDFMMQDFIDKSQ